MALRIPNTKPRAPAAAGFTIAESMIASVVLAACVVAVASTVTASYSQNNALEQNSEAVSLARQLMEEISARPFDDPDGDDEALGPAAGETSASLFDNVDDYHGYADSSTPTSVPTAAADADGDSAGGAETYARAVSVEYRETPGGDAAETGPYAIVTIQVTTPSGRTVSLTKLFSACTWKD